MGDAETDGALTAANDELADDATETERLPLTPRRLAAKTFARPIEAASRNEGPPMPSSPPPPNRFGNSTEVEAEEEEGPHSPPRVCATCEGPKVAARGSTCRRWEAAAAEYLPSATVAFSFSDAVNEQEPPAAIVGGAAPKRCFTDATAWASPRSEFETSLREAIDSEVLIRSKDAAPPNSTGAAGASLPSRRARDAEAPRPLCWCCCCSTSVRANGDNCCK